MSLDPRNLTLKQLQAYVEEVFAMVEESRAEIQALRGMLAERGAIDEEELEKRIEQIRTEELEGLEREVLRIVFEKSDEGGPVQ